MNNDGLRELVVDAGQGEVGVLSASGEPLARFPVGGFGSVVPVVSDLDVDGQPELIVPTASGTIAAYNVRRGNAFLRWEIPGYGKQR